MDRDAVTEWVHRYEQAWRAAGTDSLVDLFTEDVVYVVSPWAAPRTGLAAVREFWNSTRSDADEGFRMSGEVVAVEGRTAVVRVDVDYDDGQRWRDLWLIDFDDRERCQRFEEWPFAPDRDDGQRAD